MEIREEDLFRLDEMVAITTGITPWSKATKRELGNIIVQLGNQDTQQLDEIAINVLHEDNDATERRDIAVIEIKFKDNSLWMGNIHTLKQDLELGQEMRGLVKAVENFDDHQQFIDRALKIIDRYHA